MYPIDVYLALICISSILSINFILFGKVKNIYNQISVFVIISICVVFVYGVFQKAKGKGSGKDNGEEEITPVKSEPKVVVETSPKEETHMKSQNEPKLVKQCNKKDCTNDGSCIQKASEANLYGFHENTKKTTHTCIRCSRPLTLENNPSTEIFQDDLPSNLKKKQIMNNMCIYCKSSTSINPHCFSEQ